MLVWDVVCSRGTAQFLEVVCLSNLVLTVVVFVEELLLHAVLGLTIQITDRRRKRALAANPASEIPTSLKLQRGAAVPVNRFVRSVVRITVHQFVIPR